MPCKMRDHHGQGILRHQQLGQVVRDGAAKYGKDRSPPRPMVAPATTIKARRTATKRLRCRGSPSSDRGARKTTRARPTPGPAANRATRLNRAGGEEGGDEFPQALSVARGAGEGKGQGGEGRQFEKLGVVIAIDEGTDHEPATRAEVAINQGFVDRTMTEPDGHRRQARAWRPAPPEQSGGDVRWPEPVRPGHAQCGRGLGELAVGFRRVETERLGAVEIGEGKQRGALGIFVGSSRSIFH